MFNYVEIIVDLVSHAIDRPFHYRIPQELQGLVKPGLKVVIPLGPRRTEGYVLRLLKTTSVKPEILRDILAISDPEPLLNREQLALLSWLSHHYFCRRIDALNAMVPATLRLGEKAKRPLYYKAVKGTDIDGLKNAPLQQKALRLILAKEAVPRSDLERQGVSSATLRNLLQKGLVAAIPGSLPRQAANESAPVSPLKLGLEQSACFNNINAAVNRGKPERILLHGVTASGKTEIYMQSIACCLEKGRSALVLVPEIALTPQMINHFAGRFPGRIAVLHSRLTPAEKRNEWQAIKSGEAKVVLGARSAVFAPLDAIGLIVIDEEHETTYKQEETPRYHTRDVAWWRARYHKAVLLLGSATPSLESYYRALEGGDRLLTMAGRITPTQLPPVTVVDMRQELKANHRQIFSRLLLTELTGVMERGEQALLFINRRGFAGFVLCRECGYVVRCPSCDVSLTLHLDRQLMCCHYCAYETPVPVTCPDCGGIKIRYFSAGTQRVEDEIKKIYPAVPLIRMDSDTTTSRRAHSQYYQSFLEGRARILIGTQMIAKGFDFPAVTLVGVVAADTTLNLPDFRAPERTFQLLTQVAGRTARGKLGGKVIIQTYHPGHYAIQAAAGHDYSAFYAAEIENRRQLDYPPFSDLLRLLFSGSDEKAVFEAAAWLTGQLQGVVGTAEILGPAPASIYRIKDQYRVQTIVKGRQLSAINPGVKKVFRFYHEHKPPRSVRLSVDFNPLVVL